MAAKNSTRTQSRCLPWFGAGANVAEYHASLLADCKHVTVLFGGGLSIESFLVKTASEIVVNDKHELAVNLYRILKEPESRHQLVFDLEATPFSETILSESQDVCKKISRDGFADMLPREVAFHYFITAWMGRSGKSGTDCEFSGSLAMRWDAGGGSSPLRYKTAVRSLQDVWGPICERCSFRCKDWKDVLMKVKDDQKCGVFADPPWPGDGDGYRHKFTESDHYDLRRLLTMFLKTKVVLRYGDCALIRRLYAGDFWHIKEIGSRNQGNNKVDELLITNFAVESKQP